MLNKKSIIIVILLAIIGVGGVLFQQRDTVDVEYHQLKHQILVNQIQDIVIYDLESEGWTVSFKKPNHSETYEVFIPGELEKNVIALFEEKNIEFKTANSKSSTKTFERIYTIGYSSIMIIIIILIFRNMTGQYFTKLGKKVQKSEVRFSDVGGLNEVIDDISSITEILKNPKKFTQLGGHPPKGVIFHGPPGTGKTLIAKAVAGEANVPFIYAAASEFVELFVGVGASRVRSLYKMAKKNAPCVVFIDEIDAIGGQRGNKRSDTERDQTINQLLTALDGFEGNEGILTIVATNRIELLDKALTRPGRFNRQVHIPFPHLNSRIDIINKIIQRRGIQVDKHFDPKVMAIRTGQVSGAAIENIINTALEIVHKQDRGQLSLSDIDQAIDFILLGPKVDLMLSEEETKLIALHESGHALCAYYVSEKSRNQIYCASIIPHQGALGRLIRLNSEESMVQIQDLLNDLVVILGGRAAEYMFFQKDLRKVSVGAVDDLKKASLLAHKIITECGYAPEGTDIQKSYVIQDGEIETELIPIGLPDETKLQVEQAKDVLLREAWKQALALVDNHFDQLQKMSQFLRENQKMYLHEIRGIIGK